MWKGNNFSGLKESYYFLLLFSYKHRAYKCEVLQVNTKEILSFFWVSE